MMAISGTVVLLVLTIGAIRVSPHNHLHDDSDGETNDDDSDEYDEDEISRRPTPRRFTTTRGVPTTTRGFTTTIRGFTTTTRGFIPTTATTSAAPPTSSVLGMPASVDAEGLSSKHVAAIVISIAGTILLTVLLIIFIRKKWYQNIRAYCNCHEVQPEKSPAPISTITAVTSEAYVEVNTHSETTDFGYSNPNHRISNAYEEIPPSSEKEGGNNTTETSNTGGLEDPVRFETNPLHNSHSQSKVKTDAAILEDPVDFEPNPLYNSHSQSKDKKTGVLEDSVKFEPNPLYNSSFRSKLDSVISLGIGSYANNHDEEMCDNSGEAWQRSGSELHMVDNELYKSMKSGKQT